MIILSLGTNLGNKKQNLDRAIEELGKICRVHAVSSYYSTSPWGFSSDNSFLNCCVAVDSDLHPLQFLIKTQQIEQAMGRDHKTVARNYTDRIIDIDLIDYNNMVVSTPELRLPHRDMHRRNFVLYPLCDICADWEHPVLHKTAQQLLETSEDKSVPEPILPITQKHS